MRCKTSHRGLDRHRLTAARRWPDVYYELRPVLAGRRVVAYNAEFDRRLLDQTCDRYRLPRLRLRWECAMARYTDWRGRWRALARACALEGIATDAAVPHSAAVDAAAAWRLVQLMVDRGAAARLPAKLLRSSSLKSRS